MSSAVFNFQFEFETAKQQGFEPGFLGPKEASLTIELHSIALQTLRPNLNGNFWLNWAIDFNRNLPFSNSQPLHQKHQYKIWASDTIAEHDFQEIDPWEISQQGGGGKLLFCLYGFCCNEELWVLLNIQLSTGFSWY